MTRGGSPATSGTSPKTLLAQRGLRRTAARVGVLEALRDADGPLEASKVLRQLGHDADRVTVYRTLQTLVDRGLVHRVQGDDGVRRYALGPVGDDGHHHVHFECEQCGRVECLESAPIPDDLPRQLRVDRRYRVRNADVTLHGVCPRCTASRRT